MLESYLRKRLKERDILLMTHIVLGYPSFEDSYRMVEAMVAAGVDLMELQIPFSEPIADGPVILHANQRALASGATVQKCFDFGGKVARDFDIPFLFMTYFNILYKYGVHRFAADMAQQGLQGAIVPDLPPEEGEEYLRSMEEHGLAPIFIFSPTTADERMSYLANFARGFVYCVARKGVTGADTSFSDQLKGYMDRCRKATALPLALGFGVQGKADIDFLRGKADIAVIGTQTIRVMEQQGIEAVGEFIADIR
ncbi:tryptophan synthase subunit alpha [Desulfoferrobacter suflitae]|uniref:tryptophan synthase subunit alpha n=1 Tax=Desulfoferrobacter suflitae TaxID=2865782 RepID=UPI002164209B|nr:tryptophan synthase subunit alpha [Desulfoferrobacter suflitae]MCK8603551.1 tryptophan synthase subunit alpha [Desulfoferrobacter suflitae]